MCHIKCKEVIGIIIASTYSWSEILLSEIANLIETHIFVNSLSWKFGIVHIVFRCDFIYLTINLYVLNRPLYIVEKTNAESTDVNEG